jgi:1,2-diacylglycerol 3-beta-glucosyltransferase
MVVAIQIFMLAVFGFLLAYLAGLSILALFARWPKTISVSRNRRMAVIIPAHNEEFTIAPTVRSFQAVDYPVEDFAIIVVADNCTDRTADVAHSLGAEVHRRTSMEQRGKGYALRWILDKLLADSRGFEGYLVVDADSVVSRNILQRINGYLEKGSEVIQCSDIVRAEPGAWSAEITRIGFTLYNIVRPLGRSVLGGSAGLRGNGMAFSAELLRRIPWHAYSLAEDLEFGLHLLLHGARITFLPEVQVVATMPRNPSIAESQRTRWEGGRLPVIRRYTPMLLAAALRQRSPLLLDAWIDLVTPPLINLMVMVTFCGLLTTGLALVGMHHMSLFAILWGIVWLLGLVHMFVGLYAARADTGQYRALLYVPRYALWKMALYLRITQKGQTREWIRTGRESQSVQGHSPPLSKSTE